MPAVPAAPAEHITLLVSAPDRRGLVAALAQLLYDVGANIVHADQHLDRQAGRFFQRVQADLAGVSVDAAALDVLVAARCTELGMTLRIRRSRVTQRTAVLVSRQDHCLYDLILRQRAGELATSIACVISNHEVAGDVARSFGLPFHHLPVSAATKPAQEQALLALLREHQIDLVVLARYMQVLSAPLLEALARPVINIHHGFLPAFVGERPYHRAWERGVKLIGATAHYVTPDLDAGPIIEQDVVRIRHSDTIKDMMRLGKDVENAVLSRGLRYHLEDRVIVHGNKTILFSG